MAGILRFPRVAQEQSCSECVHALFGSSGIVCEAYNELIWNEKKAATDCPVYEVHGTQEAEVFSLKEE